MRLCITLSKEENQMVAELENMTSQKGTVLLKMALALLHKKELNAHLAKLQARRTLELDTAKNEIKPTPEQRCIAKGGEVVEIDGVMKCAMVNGALTRYELLS